MVPWLLEVPGRESIEIHPLNDVLETNGCIGVGKSIDPVLPRIYDSRKAFGELKEMLFGFPEARIEIRSLV